jgi:hypothetical protein
MTLKLLLKPSDLIIFLQNLIFLILIMFCVFLKLTLNLNFTHLSQLLSQSVYILLFILKISSKLSHFFMKSHVLFLLYHITFTFDYFFLRFVINRSLSLASIVSKIFLMWKIIRLDLSISYLLRYWFGNLVSKTVGHCFWHFFLFIFFSSVETNFRCIHMNNYN